MAECNIFNVWSHPVPKKFFWGRNASLTPLVTALIWNRHCWISAGTWQHEPAPSVKSLKLQLHSKCMCLLLMWPYYKIHWYLPYFLSQVLLNFLHSVCLTYNIKCFLRTVSLTSGVFILLAATVLIRNKTFYYSSWYFEFKVLLTRTVDFR